MLTAGIRTEGSLLDRFYDWQDAMDEDSCTYSCGWARDDICVCRCGGLHHNAKREYYASLPKRMIIERLPGGTTIRRFVYGEIKAESC